MPMPQIAAPAPTAPTAPSTVRAVRVAAGGTSRRCRCRRRGRRHRRRRRRCSRRRSPCCGSRRCRRRGWSRSLCVCAPAPASAVQVPSPTLPKPALRSAFLASSSERPETSGTARPSPLLGLIVTVLPPATLPASGVLGADDACGLVGVDRAADLDREPGVGQRLRRLLDRLADHVREVGEHLLGQLGVGPGEPVAAVGGVGRALDVPRDAVADVGEPHAVVGGLEDVPTALDVAHPRRGRDLGAGLDQPRLELFVGTGLADERRCRRAGLPWRRCRRSSRPAARRPRSPRPSGRGPGLQVRSGFGSSLPSESVTRSITCGWQ